MEDGNEADAKRKRHEIIITQFTTDQKDRLLKMLEAHERAVWLWSSVGVWAKWLVSVAAAVAVIQAVWSGYWKGPPIK